MEANRAFIRLKHTEEPRKNQVDGTDKKREKTSKKKGKEKVKEKGENSRRLAPMMRALRAIHSTTTPDTMNLEDLARQRAGQELLGRLVAPMVVQRKWEPFRLGEMDAAWVKPDWPHDTHKVVLYCHGGGYTSGNLGYSRPLASKLTGVTGWETMCFEYRLAPEHPFPAALEDAQRAWDHLMLLGYGARDIVLVGDSAGGNLALVLCHCLKEEGRQLPGRLVLMSPWTDMTASGLSYTKRAELDPTITMDYIRAVRTVYAGAHDIASPHLSPLFGDFTGFPSTLIQVGSNELLYSDSLRLRDRMQSAHVHCQLEVWEDMWHVFQMFPIRKAALAMESVGEFVRTF